MRSDSFEFLLYFTTSAFLRPIYKRLWKRKGDLNHRMAEFGRDLWRWSGPISLLKQGHPELVAQDHVQRAFEYSPGDSTNSLGNLCQCSVTFMLTKYFLKFRANCLCFSVCPLPLVLSLGTTEKSLAPSCLHPLFRYFYTSTRSL